MPRSELKVLGKALGTYDGWDGEMPSYVFYDFQPATDITIQAGNLSIDYDTGMFDVSDDTGDILDTGEILPLLK